MLAGAIAHDFNNLLHVIMLNADLAKKGLAPDSKPAVSIDRLMTTVERAAELCSELLAYSGRGQFTIEPFDLQTIVEEMQSLLDISIPKGVKITVSGDGSDTVVQGDVTQIRQVLMNLITNAGEAVDPTTGEIEVEVASRYFNEEALRSGNYIEAVAAGPFVSVTVTDNGQGMDTETLLHMFDPFYTTKETGHGLGLSAVLGIIRGHDGTIEISSTPGQGTTARVLLPKSEARPAIERIRNDDLPATRGSGIVLFADDESDIRQLAMVVLEDSGYQVIEAEDRQAAVELFRKHHEQLHLVILDLMMPVKTGLEAYLEISDIDKSVPVVFSSGFNESDALDQLPPKTRSAFLKKPYLAAELKQFVLDIIGPRN
ncbi:MAG: response regulator [Pseudomonadales bacterium]|nr:response regulator [Pseudomonadales bacterium]